MTPIEVMGHVIDLRARNAAQRQIIVRLLAYLAKNVNDPEALFREFSEASDEMIDGAGLETPPEMQTAEAVRRETDYLLTAARQIAGRE